MEEAAIRGTFSHVGGRGKRFGCAVLSKGGDRNGGLGGGCIDFGHLRCIPYAPRCTVSMNGA
jgi:hypothetical protein